MENAFHGQERSTRFDAAGSLGGGWSLVTAVPGGSTMHGPAHAAEERAVSTVIGVVLMVAITVLLAATAASFLLDLGRSGTRRGAPTVVVDAEFDAEAGGHQLLLSHQGGETVTRSNVRVVVTGATCGGPSAPDGRYTPRALGVGATKLVAGTTMELDARTLCRSGPGPLDLSHARVTVVWMSETGGQSDTLLRWRGPSS